MAARAPLQLVLFRHEDDLDVRPYEDAIARVFQGGKDAGGYLANGEDLGIQFEIFSAAPKVTVPEVFGSFGHTLTVVLIDRALLEKTDATLWDWLEGCWSRTKDSGGQHAMIALALDERVGSQFSEKRTALGSLQLLQAEKLGERAIRPAMFALRVLHECRILLAAALRSVGGHRAGYLRLFISHAKMDGLPLAHALKHLIDLLGWLQDFYDVDDLPAGSDWQRELEQGVGSSLLVILRTDGYDSRPWCQQEVFWADEYATPAVLVDARTSLNYPAGILPLDRIPTARIPDGNLLRILFLALREGLRFLYFNRQVEQMKRDRDLPDPVELRVFAFQPSMIALMRACRSLALSKEPASTPRMILYPDPTFRSGLYEAAQALVATYLPSARLVTPQTIAATKGPAP